MLTLLIIASLLSFCNGFQSLGPQKVKSSQFFKDLDEPLYLTPFIEAGKLEEAREASKVDTKYLLHGEKWPLSYSGFLTVKNESEGNTFFWFIPSKHKHAPVVIWLQGGPGASSLFGLLEVHGPMIVVKKGYFGIKLESNPHSWHHSAHMIYIDNPVGTGFSHTKKSGFTRKLDEVADDLYEFLIQWFTLFPEYQKNDFYPFGESYAGKFVPAIANKIHESNQKSPKIFIRLKGMGIGDGWMSPPHSAVYADFLYQAGLIDGNLKNKLLTYEKDIDELVHKGKFRKAQTVWNREFQLFLNTMGCSYGYDIRQCYTDVEEDNYEKFLGRRDTKKAIHVGNIGFGSQSNLVFKYMEDDFMKSEIALVEKMLNLYKVLIYDGNMDIICNHSGVLNMFEAMTNWKGKAEYKSAINVPYKYGKRVVGYIKKAHNLRMFVMRNAGHMVPMSQPEHSAAMFKDFLRGHL